MGEKTKIKSYEELEFIDDFLFCKIMMNEQELCKEITELIIGRKIGSFVTQEKQKSIEITMDGKGVRFDVYLEDDEGTAYDIEMQAYREENLPKRTRYYQGMIDLNLIERGTKYRDLKKSYIVFICLNNPFKEYGRHKYTIIRSCVEEPVLKFEDDACAIILSAKGDKDDVSEGLKDFLHYLATKEARSELTRKVEESVIRSRSQERWRIEYMTLQEHDDRIREQALKEGLEEGIEKGIEKGFREGKIKVLVELCRDGNLSLEEAARRAEMPVDEFERAMDERLE